MFPHLRPHAMDQDTIAPRSIDEHERAEAVPCTGCAGVQPHALLSKRARLFSSAGATIMRPECDIYSDAVGALPTASADVWHATSEAGEIPDEDTIETKQSPLVACGDDEFWNETEAPTTGDVTRHTTQTTQATRLTDHHATLDGCSSEDEATGNPTDDGLAQFQAATSDLCSVLDDDGEGMQRHEHPLAAGMSMGHESRRLSFRTLALVRHGVALWRTRAWGRTWCLRLGMTASSWDGWAKMHVHPLAAMRFYFLPMIGVIFMRVYLFTGLPMNANFLLFYAVTVPHGLNIALVVAVNCAMFRFGPQVAVHCMYPLVALLYVTLSLPVWYVGYIGPQDTVPWNNRFKFLAFGSAEILLAHLAGAAGGLPGEHPVEPRTSIRKPVLRAIIQTLRLTDSLTDLSLIAELIVERRRGCWLFGVSGRCGAWNWLIGLFCTFAAFDLIVALATSLSGRESMESSQAKKRTFFSLHCVALGCELGIVACTLVHLYNLRHPGNAAREDFNPAQQHSNLGLTFFSLATTLLTFMLNLVGTSKALAAARSAVARVSRQAGFRRGQFAATAATIVSGAVAERTRFVAYIAYVIFLSSWVYPVLAHWTWSAHGWASPALPPAERLFGVGLIDFAGCCPVHMIGGVSALAGAYIVGPRKGRFEKDGTVNDIEGHNASLAILGVFILWFGWYGFNPGSALAILGSSEIAALAAINTTISAAAGTLAALIALMVKGYYAAQDGRTVWDLLGAANGTLGGLVAITAGCVVVQPWAAILIGISGGLMYVFASWLISDVMMVDDPLDAGAVHCFCGAWGLIVAAAFAHKPFVEQVYGADTAAAGHGFLMPGGNLRMLLAAGVAIIAAAAWTLGMMVPFFYALNSAGVMRVSDEEEDVGLDRAYHGGHAYDHDEGADEDTRDVVINLCKQMEMLANQQYQVKEQVEMQMRMAGGADRPGSGHQGPAPAMYGNPAFDDGGHGHSGASTSRGIH